MPSLLSSPNRKRTTWKQTNVTADGEMGSMVKENCKVEKLEGKYGRNVEWVSKTLKQLCTSSHLLLLGGHDAPVYR